MDGPRRGSAGERLRARAAPGVRALSPYEPGKPVEALERELGIRDALKLASNENPLGCGEAARRAAARALDQLAVYPDGNGHRLKRTLSERLGVGPERITLGNGSNDVLELVARAFLTPGSEAVYAEHAFAVYPLATRAAGATGREAPARDHGHDPAALRAAVSEATRVVFVANPNNPTGTWLSGDALRGLIASLPDDVVVVVDEAYHEYVREGGYASAMAWIEDFSNLVVTRTFSKVHGLAALRVGYAVSSPEVADLLNRVRQPFNVNAPALAAAEAALDDEAFVARSVAVNAEGLDFYARALGERGLAFIPSAGNFVAVDVGREAAPVYQALLRRGVIVRPVASYGLPRHLRITVGLPEQNRRVIAALEAVLAGA